MGPWSRVDHISPSSTIDVFNSIHRKLQLAYSKKKLPIYRGGPVNTFWSLSSFGSSLFRGGSWQRQEVTKNGELPRLSSNLLKRKTMEIHGFRVLNSWWILNIYT